MAAHYYYSNSPESDPRGPASGPDRVIRGGSWDTAAAACRVAYRYSYGPECVYEYDIGFRSVLPSGP
jgi:formylglycine-generating enzyme required for sulfatase activity